jgi:hypothetical protein
MDLGTVATRLGERERYYKLPGDVLADVSLVS